jgi:hypothetical protein
MMLMSEANVNRIELFPEKALKYTNTLAYFATMSEKGVGKIHPF